MVEYKQMYLHNESEIVEDVKWFKVSGTPLEFSKVALYNNDIWLPISAFNLTNANVITYMIETDSGEALVTKTGKIYLSGQTIIDMAVQAQPDKVEELEECIALLFEKATEAEIIQYPVNQTLM